MRHEVERRIAYIERRLQTETTNRTPWVDEKKALRKLLERDERMTGILVALELIASIASADFATSTPSASRADFERIKRIADEALMRKVVNVER